MTHVSPPHKKTFGAPWTRTMYAWMRVARGVGGWWSSRRPAHEAWRMASGATDRKDAAQR